MRNARAWNVAFFLAAAGCAGQGPAPVCPATPPPVNERAESHSKAPEAPERSYTAEDAIQHPAQAITFQAGPPSMPQGMQQAVLEGDPRRAGMFTLRLTLPAGFLLLSHTHPQPERVTVLSGSVAVGFGDEVARDQARTFEAGSFYVNPPGVPHFVLSDGGAVVQITGQGPWQVEMVGPEP